MPSMDGEVLRRNLESVHQQLARLGADGRVTLVAVSKGQPAEGVVLLRQLGVVHFGESRYQETEARFNSLAGVRVDFIGHLQGNKVAKVLRRYHAIQSVDSLSCLQRIIRSSHKGQPCHQLFFEVNPLQQVNKHGFTCYSDLHQAARYFLHHAQELSLVGLMTLAPIAEEKTVRRAFTLCREWHQQLTRDLPLPDCTQLSMGMSDDYHLAVAEGSTMIRLGRALFRGAG